MGTLLLLCKDETGDNAKQFKMLKQPYPYLPLGDRQIQLLPILPGLGDIEVTIDHAYLDSELANYEALLCCRENPTHENHRI
jgi:hypothetical protein